MKALVGTVNQEKALVGAFSVITNLRVDLFHALHLHVRQHVVDEGVLNKVKVHQLVLGRYKHISVWCLTNRN